MASSSARSRAGSSSVLPGALPLLLVGLLLLAAATTAAAAAAPPAPPTPPPGTAPVSSAAQFLKALEDPAVNSISVMKPFAMPHGPGVKPAVVQRQVLITSPIRAMIDWCDKQCQAAGSKAGSPLIIMGKVREAAVVLQSCRTAPFLPPCLAAGAVAVAVLNNLTMNPLVAASWPGWG